MQISDINLTNHELEVIKNTDFLLAKRVILNKVMQLFEETGQFLDLNMDFAGESHLSRVRKLRHKVTRGENYSDLPFVALDFPGISGGESVFTLRTLFLWGRYFSFNLIVKGPLMDDLRGNISANFHKLRKSGFRVCGGDDCWNNLVEGPDYVDPEFLDVSGSKRLFDRDFFRAGKTHPLDDWGGFRERALENYLFLLDLLR